jgi:hypothetical protein
MRNAVRQVGRHAGNAGRACLDTGQPMAPNAYGRSPLAALAAPSAKRRVTETGRSVSLRGAEVSLLRFSNREIQLLESSLSHRKQSTAAGSNRESLRMAGETAQSATPRFSRFEFPFSIFGISRAYFYPSLLPSRIRRNSLKTNDGDTCYPSLERGGFGQP